MLSSLPLCRVNTAHNRCVTQKIVRNVKEAGEYTSSQTIECKHLCLSLYLSSSYFFKFLIDAAKKYHEYLVRQDKPLSEDQRRVIARNGRILQRRQRVCHLSIIVCVNVWVVCCLTT